MSDDDESAGTRFIRRDSEFEGSSLARVFGQICEERRRQKMTIPSEMVERGAKAMYERKFRAEGFKWEDSTAQDEWRELMRAAILAMREPTEAMVERTWMQGAGPAITAGGPLAMIEHHWRLMIDEALR